jgi:PadR family transcriptional regulator, regulatory protein AphA
MEVAMAKENRSKYALLGLLSWGPMSGYGIKKAVEQSISNFWNESYGQIYPILKRLAAEGLATTSIEQQAGKPDRHVYALTEKGRNALQRWLRKPAEHEVGRVEFLLKLFFGRQVTMPHNIRHVRQLQALQRQLLRRFDAIEQQLRAEHANNPDLPYWLLTISYGRHLCQARLRWCDEALTRLNNMSREASAERGEGMREPCKRIATITERHTS